MHEDKIKVWQDRYTVRKFSENNKTINFEDIKYIKKIFKHIPTQCGTKQIVWLYLSNDKKDLKFRKWLVDNCYNADLIFEGKSIKEYFLPVYQAPGLILGVQCDIAYVDMLDRVNYKSYHGRNQKEIQDDYSFLSIRNEGIYTGVLLTELLHLNYSVGTFGCTNGFNTDKENKVQYFTNYLKTNYENELKEIINYQVKDTYDNISFYPGIAITFGPQGNSSDVYALENYEKYDYVNERKAPIHREITNIIIDKNTKI